MTPIQIFFAIVSCFGLAGGDAPVQGGSSSLGIISQVHGEVLLERGSAKTAARLAELLYPGDRITTAAGQAVILFCPTPSTLAVPDNTTIELGLNDVKTLKGNAPARAPAKCLLPRIALGAESMERLGGLRARNEIPVSLYLGGIITGDRPVFRWAPVGGAQSYSLTLKDANLDTSIWQTSTSATSVAYPETLPPLGKIPYEWEVLALADGRTLARGSAGFEIKPNPALAAEVAALPEERLMRAIGLENEGYYAEAANYYREFRNATPGDTRLTRHLAWLYWNAGLIVAANDELRRLADNPQK